MLLNPAQSRKLLEYAMEKKFAVLAVNADSPAAITDCLKAAKEAESPVIIEASLWQLEGRSFGGGDAVLGLARYIAETAVLANAGEFMDVPVLLHTDHIKGPKTWTILSSGVRGVGTEIGDAELKLSPSTISLDASEMSAEENIDFLDKLITVSKECDRLITLEMEAGVDKGVSSLDEAKALVGGIEEKHPGYIYMYAPGLGSQHGFSESGYSGFRPDMAAKNLDAIEETIGRRIGIAVHGSSGLGDDQLREAVASGVIKINWSTENLIIRSAAAREYYEKNGDKVDPVHKQFKVTAMDTGLQQYVAEQYIPKVLKRMDVLNSKGQNPGFWAVAGISK
jgi:fructose-bisphosphate aldolase class II